MDSSHTESCRLARYWKYRTPVGSAVQIEHQFELRETPFHGYQLLQITDRLNPDGSPDRLDASVIRSGSRSECHEHAQALRRDLLCSGFADITARYPRASSADACQFVPAGDLRRVRSPQIAAIQAWSQRALFG